MWRAERRKGVTATDIAAIVGLSPYESAYSLYLKKLGIIPDEHSDDDRLRLGRELEPIIRDRWCASPNGQPWAFASCLWRSTERPWQLATPDCVAGIDRDREHPGRQFQRVAPLELKSWADADRHHWDDGPPPLVRAQVLWQMDTLDVATGHVGVLFLPSGEFHSYVIEHADVPGHRFHDEAHRGHECPVCKDIQLMRAAARDFLDRIDLRDPPSADGSNATLAALRKRFPPHKGKEAEIDADLWTIWSEWKDAEDSAGHLAKTFEAQIREQLGEATILTVGGAKVGTRVISHAEVKAHTRHQDYIRRTPNRRQAE